MSRSTPPDPPGERTRPPRATRYLRGLLWRIEADAVAPSHLFGTMHTDDPRVLAVAPAVRHALHAAHSFTAELALSEQARRQLARSMYGAQGAALDELLDARDWARLDAAMAERGIDAQSLRRMKPWAALVSLLAPAPAGAGVALDLALLRAARVAGKSIRALETVAEQVSVFDDLSVAQQLQLLRDLLRGPARRGPMLARLTDAYLARDLVALLRLAEEQLGASDRRLGAQLMRRLVAAREGRMFRRMLPGLRAGGTFVAVGALHLPGLLARAEAHGLLVSRGY